jgi:hypothetical protein
MLKFSHTVLISLSGALWLVVGFFLMPKGIKFLIESAEAGGDNLYLLNGLNSLGISMDSAALILIAIGLAIGYGKSRAIFSKAVKRGVAHIRSLPAKAPITAVYTPKYLLLLGVMVLLGLSMTWFKVPLDIRGLVDVAVASALINGSMMYFRNAIQGVKDECMCIID